MNEISDQKNPHQYTAQRHAEIKPEHRYPPHGGDIGRPLVGKQHGSVNHEQNQKHQDTYLEKQLQAQLIVTAEFAYGGLGT